MTEVRRGFPEQNPADSFACSGAQGSAQVRAATGSYTEADFGRLNCRLRL
jgi:hypothetical protein